MTIKANTPNEYRPGTALPTRKQHDMLLNLGSGSAGLSWGRRDTEPLLRRGWVTAELRESFYQWVRITPDGLAALARSVEKFGLPDLGPQPRTHVRVCSDCGSTRYHARAVDADEVVASRYSRRRSNGTPDSGASAALSKEERTP